MTSRLILASSYFNLDAEKMMKHCKNKSNVEKKLRLIKDKSSRISEIELKLQSNRPRSYQYRNKLLTHKDTFLSKLPW
jgi:transposase